MPVSNRINVFIVDDHPIIREGIAERINRESDMWVCGEAGDNASAKKGIQKHRPDIVMIDLTLGKESGIELIEYVAAHHPDIAILVLSHHEDPYYIENALRAGAKGYFHKTEPVKQYPVAIRKIMNGQNYYSNNIANTLIHRFIDESSPEKWIHRLTQRQFEIFTLLGKGIRRHQIADLLYITPKTVSVHIENIKNALEFKSSEEVVQFAIEWVHKESGNDHN